VADLFASNNSCCGNSKAAGLHIFQSITVESLFAKRSAPGQISYTFMISQPGGVQQAEGKPLPFVGAAAGSICIQGPRSSSSQGWMQPQLTIRGLALARHPTSMHAILPAQLGHCIAKLSLLLGVALPRPVVSHNFTPPSQMWLPGTMLMMSCCAVLSSIPQVPAG
jgi:hypothetical protein